MSLVDLFRPKWKHSDAATRATAVRELGSDDINILQTIAQSDQDPGVRRIAIKRLDDPQILAQISRSDSDQALRQIAADKVLALLVSAACADEDEDAALAALGQIDDPKALAEIARTAQSAGTRRAALERVDDDKALAEVTRKSQDPQIRLEALGRINDVGLLRSLALTETRKEICTAAVERIDDSEALETVARKAKNKSVRTRARKKLANLDGAAADESAPTARKGKNKRASKRGQAQWLRLCETTEVLARSSDWERSGLRIEEAQQEWDRIDGEPDAELSQRMERAVELFFSRLQAHKQRLAELAQQEQELRQTLARHTALIAEVPAADSPDALGQLRKRWEALPPLASNHQATLDERFAAACTAWFARHEQKQDAGQRREQLETIVSNAEQLPGGLKPAQAAKRYDALLAEWRGANVGQDEPELCNRLQAVGQRLQDQRERVRKQRDKERQEAREQIENLCANLEQAAECDDLKGTEQLLKSVSGSRKRLSKMQTGAERDALEQRLDAARERAFTKAQELREAEEWKRWAVVPKLEALCTRVEALAKQEELKTIAPQLRAAQAEWKQAGPAPRSKSNALWKRFKKASDAAYARCQDHFANADQEREANLQAKLALCKEAEELVAEEPSDKPGFDRTANSLKELQAKWKKIGQVPRAQSNDVWKRFRGACDQFFDRRKAFMDRVGGEFDANLKLKEQLCEQAESLSKTDVADPETTDKIANQLKGLQAQWKKIGRVPRAQSDGIWKRFRSACDQFFDRRQQQLDAERRENQERKEVLCARLEGLLGREPQHTCEPGGATQTQSPDDDRLHDSQNRPEPAEAEPAVTAEPRDNTEELAKQVLEIRAEWRQIGPVAQEEMDALFGRYDAACEVAISRHPRAFEGTELDPAVNLNRRERLCLRAEELADSIAPQGSSDAPAADPSSGSVEQMADQLRNALAANTFRKDGAAEHDIQEVARETKRLQSQWRRIGPVPGDAGAAIARRFSAATDRIFDVHEKTEQANKRPKAKKKGKRAVEDSKNGAQQENLQQKLALCTQAEALAASDDPTEHREQAQNLCQQWKAIGPVPRNKYRRLWNRFRRACDTVMGDAAPADTKQEATAQQNTQAEAQDNTEGANSTQTAEPLNPATEERQEAAPEAQNAASDTPSPSVTVAAANAAVPGPATEVPAGWDETVDDEWDVFLEEGGEQLNSESGPDQTKGV